MSSGIVNDLLQDSLAHLQAQSAKVLNELAELHINDNSPILLPISAQGDTTPERSLSPSLENPVVEAAVRKLETVQDSFSEITALVMGLQSNSQKSTVKLNNKLLNLKKLTEILKPFENGSIVKSVSAELEATMTEALTAKELDIVAKLEQIVSMYGLIALYQISLTQLLTSTLPLGDDLLYWELTSSSSWRTLLYALQTLPLRAKELVSNVCNDFVHAASPDVNALQISVPQYITTHYPSYQSTYKLFIHYKRIIIDSLYNNIIANNIKGFYKFIASSKSYHNAMFGPKKVKPNIKQYINVMLGAPFASVIQELQSKRDAVKALQDKNAKKLGNLLLNVPNLKDAEFDEKKVQQSLRNVQSILSEKDLILTGDALSSLYQTASELIPNTKKDLASQTTSAMKPSFLVRYWPTLLTVLLYGPSTVGSIVTNRELILEFIHKNLVETITGFWNNWILKPVNDILSTIRHDDNSEISIMSQKSLDSDLESLKRMVIEYTIENTPEYKDLKSTDIELLKRELNTMVSTGDMTPMMKGYEQDIKKPLKNLVSGRLPRALLIQLQKTKVDGAVAISGIDKLLKSQQLVFGIVAASPSLLILVYLLNGVNAYLKKGYISRSTGENKLIVSRNLNDVERLLSSLDDTESDLLDYVNGMLLLQIISLRTAGLLLVPANRRFEWVRDINDLVNSKASTRSRLSTVSRIYHVYGVFFQ